ncbi:hypothetical protein B0A79_20830 [Flavobacterium piscis]|uniref:Uncharacterized protein n=1 Tax=Flavobacterium piscis TaxID=1114874 RepID=A0ABX2XGK3_9FLAO|nr:hypothetical protein FLP_15940 [Flavobacterium piscis]OXE98151.1 hypothetical protein B0A79_20830 [Flavobacterium piscis]
MKTKSFELFATKTQRHKKLVKVMSNRTVCSNSKNENRFVPLCLRGRSKLVVIVVKKIKKAANIAAFYFLVSTRY